VPANSTEHPPRVVREGPAAGRSVETHGALSARLARSHSNSARNQEQIDAGQAIQRRLYPRSAPHRDGFDISGEAHPAEFLCGDYYDFPPMSDGSVGLTIADVCGHGVGPSILMVQARAYLRMLALDHEDVGEVLTRLNEILTVEGSEREYVTQMLARLDARNRKLTYANAGHHPGLIFDGTGTVRRKLPSGGPPLGIVANRRYPTSEPIPLGAGDVVVLHSDGVVESENPAGEEFGFDRLVDVVARNRGSRAYEIQEALCDAAGRFRAPAPQADDLTVLVCKVGS
jgi:serine phosphatase RsbU (regulator of sigma subunit)